MITRDEFVSRLREATARAVRFARAQVLDTIHEDELRYDILLVPHANDSPRAIDPQLEPLWLRSRDGLVTDCSAAEVVDALWHDGRVPAWIDLCLHSTDGRTSFFEVRCAPSLAGAQDLWYEEAKIPPFHITGPPMPRPAFERLERARLRGEEPHGIKFIMIPRAQLRRS
jgi:hypothetical protein